MKKNILLRTNIIICIIIIIGFLLTAVLSYKANYSSSIENIEQVADLTSEGIFYQLTSIFAKPVNVSLTMANDSLLKECLKQEAINIDDSGYIDTIHTYLEAYRLKYGYDSVFLVSEATRRYYNFNGVDRLITEGNPENVWYFDQFKNDNEYSLVVDNDEVTNANNELTVFVNCKVKDDHNNTLGIVGVGMRVDYLQELLKSYENEFGISTFLIDETGIIEVGTHYTGYKPINLFEMYNYSDESKKEILEWKEENISKNFWTAKINANSNNDYIVTRYIPEANWHLVIERDTSVIMNSLQRQFYFTLFIILLIIMLILFIITCVIRSFNKRITELTEDKEKMFREATEQLYDNIYEFDITHNCTAGERTAKYFESLGASPNATYDEALKVVARKQIKKEFQDGYIKTFSSENILREYENGNNHLRYDFMISENSKDYFWMRIDAYIYYLPEDNSIHMFTYRKNIDDEKRQEINMADRAQRDSMTGLYNRMSTQWYIEKTIAENPNKMFAFFIFDIDNFKYSNDIFGHAFGDFVIGEFVNEIKIHFKKEDTIGRIGGDEFAVFASIPNEEWVIDKASELLNGLRKTCTSGVCSWKMSASIGVAVVPKDGNTFDAIYKNADFALYQTKKSGKNGYTIYKKQI